MSTTLGAKAASEVRVAYVIDDDDDFRRSTVLLLEVAGWNATGFPSASAFLDVQVSLRSGPLLLDVRMPRVGGLELLESGSIDRSKFVTIVITGHADIKSAVRALKAGALDFLEKPFSAEDILRSMDAARTYLIFETGRKHTLEQSNELVSRLTAREMHVLQGLISGLPYKLVAHHLEISVRTVEMHRAKLLRKLGVRSNAEAVRIGVFGNVGPLQR